MKAEKRPDVHQSLIIFGVPLITILVLTPFTLDPVNLPKMVLLSTLGFSLIFFVVKEVMIGQRGKSHIYLHLNLLFLLWIIIATFFSGSTPVQSLFGVTGRFTGALTYISFIIVALAIFLQQERSFYQKIWQGLIFAGCFNIIYCGFVILSKKDPIPWTNVYGEILGTFGNPNFISSFLGIFITTLFSKVLENKSSTKFKFGYVLIIFFAFLEILDSHSRQGVIVVFIGCGSLIVYKVFTSKSAIYLKIAVLSAYVLSGTLTVLGMLQIGPLTQFVYKASVSIRGAYWRAGWETMLQNPILGVGPDSFGDWYTRVRDERALVVPGPDVFTNSPHNVFIEQGANGGIPLFIIYILIQVVILFNALNHLWKSKEFDFLFGASFFGWLGFTAQSLISINQIGLAIWGHVLGAMTLGLSLENRKKEIKNQLIPKDLYSKKSKKVDTKMFFVCIGSIVGLTLSMPPFYADAQYRSALKSKDVNRLIAAADQWPQSTDRTISAVKALYENKFESQALDFTRKGLKFNPNSARLWNFLYQLPGATAEERQNAIKNLKKLDPYYVVK